MQVEVVGHALRFGVTSPVARVLVATMAVASCVHALFVLAGNALGTGHGVKQHCVAALWSRRISVKHNRPS